MEVNSFGEGLTYHKQQAMAGKAHLMMCVRRLGPRVFQDKLCF